MIPFVNNPDVVGSAQDLLLSQFDGKPNVNGTVEAIVDPLQDVQDTLYAMLTQTYVTNAVGAQLDIVGQYVGIQRLGKSDDLFRLFIQVQIAINNSQGLPDQLEAIMLLITGGTNCLYIPYYPAAMFLQVNVDLEAYLAAIGVSQSEFQMLFGETIPAGVLLYPISWYNGPHNAFGFLEDPDALGYDQGEYAATLY